MPASPRREMAIVVARRADDSEVERHEMSLEDYYQSLHEMIDSDDYRRERGIVVIEGQLIDPAGKVFQEFRNRYGNDGGCEGGRTSHADGTVIEIDRLFRAQIRGLESERKIEDR